MGKNRSRLIFLVIFVLILSSYLLFKNQVKKIVFPEKINQPFSFISPKKVTRVIFATNGAKETVYKKNNGWFVKKENIEYPADAQRIGQIIIDISSIAKGEIISSNKKNHQDLGIDKDKITLKTKNRLYNLYIGQLSGSEKNYVRVGEENDVFTVRGLTTVFSPFDYRDLKVNLITADNKVTKIWTGNSQLTKKKDKWFIGNKEAKKDRVDFFLNDLKTLKATDVIPENPLLGLTGSAAEFQMTITENGKTTYLQFHLPTVALAKAGKKDEQSYYLKTSKNDFLYTIPNVYVSSLKKEEKDFIE